MILDAKGELLLILVRQRLTHFVCGGSFKLPVVLDQHPIMQHRDGARVLHHITLPDGLVEDDVIGLKLASFTAGIDQRRRLAIDRTRLSIGIGLIVITVKDLYFMLAHEEDAAVAASLSLTLPCGRRSPLDVELAIPEGLLGADFALGDLHGAVHEFPRARTLVLGHAPRIQVRAVKEDDGIGGRLARFSLNHLRPRAVHVMNAPRMRVIRRVTIQCGQG